MMARFIVVRISVITMMKSSGIRCPKCGSGHTKIAEGTGSHAKEAKGAKDAQGTQI